VSPGHKGEPNLPYTHNKAKSKTRGPKTSLFMHRHDKVELKKGLLNVIQRRVETEETIREPVLHLIIIITAFIS